MARTVTKSAYIANHMTLGKATVEKLEAIEDNGKRVEAVGNTTKLRMVGILVMFVKNLIMYTYK